MPDDSDDEDLSIGSEEIERANKASASQISKSLVPDPTFIFKVQLAESLDESTRSLIWSMFETNMRAMYTTSSFGWDPPHKKGELFNRLSRFILVYPTTGTRSLVAFTAFRFEFEDDKNILYCYDLQVAKQSQRSGLGRALMNHLAKIGADFGLDKIILTVFKVNKRALKFYKSFGFEMDPDSPNDDDEEDYKLLFKNCR
ncbi:acyl-CoA N-acyltransferase [Mycena capillaripes]|nr:acyl-CoA N-acyltransferase [Mycena capillaripes]